MTFSKSLLILVGVATVLAFGRTAHAVTCTVNGTITLNSQDAYYCDPDVLGSSACQGWQVVDLDDITVPLQYMAVGVYSQPGAFLAQTTTDANGFYSATFQLGGTQCAGQSVDMRLYFARAHESDVGLTSPRWRFWVTHLTNPAPPNNPLPDGDLWARTELKQLTGPTSTYNRHWSRTATYDTTRAANVYFTASEYMREVTTWSSNLDASFTYGPLTGPLLRIGLEDTWSNGGYAAGPYDVVWSWNDYAGGGAVRHELGHVTHMYAHKLQRDSTCETYEFNGDLITPQHHPRGCEYGPSAVSEGIATFFATASATSPDTNTEDWFCSCHDAANAGANWDLCSEKAALTSDPDGDSDWLFDCGFNSLGNKIPGDFWYLGDHRISSTSNCNRLALEFDCECPGGSTFDSAKGWHWCNSTSEGWRNEVQVSRFFWDIVDNNNDSGLDDTNLSKIEFIAGLEAMPCAGNLAGLDGSCEEQAVPPMRLFLHPLGACGLGGSSPPCQCVPDAGATTPTGTGTRDSYNIYDLSDMFAGGQHGERALNCGHAPD